MRGVTEQRALALAFVYKFQLTRLMRGVTTGCSMCGFGIQISTHTPHARRDDSTKNSMCCQSKFQLTRLMRGVTNTLLIPSHIPEISTHTPHARRDIMV